MKTQSSLQEIFRVLRNLIRVGVIVELDLKEGLCRVQSGGIQTTWLNWLTTRAGRSRTWWAPSVGEQVLLLAIGGELDTAFVLPGIFSDDNPAPSASADAWHVTFPDGAVIEYEPETGALTVSGIKTADVTASDSITATVPVVLVKAETRITLDTPEVVCTNKLTTGTLEVQKGSTMRGNIEHTCKHPGKADHSHLEIFLHTDYVPGGDRHAQSPIHRTPDHRRSKVRRSRTHRQRCVPRSRDF
ncbi:phage baseplate assembly protein V [Klebsiella pneumoniae]|nr:phage baseplate assembly protein V [Klebsiella pneumoniae]HBQ7271636.1 phage baseplate assembly protein V [Klebsiella pneumoniae]HBR3223247.1 phage baseplate assembly protein V [Klebsiella pneumoniae]HBW4828614.1 phage baseplate assembly protein V [Klebsiella pneumoniae]HBW4850526.1 phage baseplate assembly protein V [Klebsiella pneumoniae]